MAKIHIYAFPGQGADRRLFDSLRIDSSYVLQVIEYGTPEKGMNLQSFARSLAQHIDTTNPFVLLGVSLGGMICVELAEFLNPIKTIIISSAKNRSELPKKYKFQKAIPVYQIFPAQTLLWGAKIMQPIVEPDRNKNEEVFKSMLSGKSAKYMKRTIALIIHWERKENSKFIYHIHGTEDNTIPVKNIKKPFATISQGSHMMTLTKGIEVSKQISSILAIP